MATQERQLLRLTLALVFVLQVPAAKGNCFSTSCTAGDGLAQCMAGSWTCGDHQFCRLDVSHTAVISMSCQNTTLNQACHSAAFHNGGSCSPLLYPPHGSCTYCCDTEACVRHIAGVMTTPDKQLSCFGTYCSHHTHLDTCVNGRWNCSADQFCRFEAQRNGQITMHCQSQQHELHKCVESLSHNVAACVDQPRFPPDTDCRYCCVTERCVRDLVASAALGAVTTPTSTTTTTTTITPAIVTTVTSTTPAPDFTTAVRAAVRRGHTAPGGGHSCLTTTCQHHADLAHCMTGTWACQHNQYCKFDAHVNGDVVMHCQPLTEIRTCQTHNTCSSMTTFPPAQACTACCENEACLRLLLVHNHATTAAPQVRGPVGCFTTPCDHHSDLAHCMAGTWACQHDLEYCKFDAHVNGDIMMHCHSLADFDKCHNTCSSLTTLPPTQACTACCRNETCLHHLMDHNHTATAAPQVHGPVGCFTTPCDHHSDLAHCTAGTWACQPHQFCHYELHANGDVKMHCQNSFDGHDKMQECQTHFQNQIHWCSPLTSLPPSHNCDYCCQDAACVHAVTSHLTSHVTPTVAPAATVTTDTATLTTTTTTATTTTTTATTTHAATTSATAASSTVAQTAVTTAPAASVNTDTTNRNTDTAALITTTTTTQAGQCVQCGDYGNKTHCTDAELFNDDVSPCPHTNTPFCQTDVIVDALGAIAIFKRCVNQHVCQTQWYDQTSDKPVCLNFDPAGATPNLACHFCCHGDGCNRNIVPEYTLQWRP